MKKLNLEVLINAPAEKVWDAVVNVKKYEKWTSAFHEGSTFEGGWNKGDSIRFWALNEDGKKEGMVSEIAESRYPEFISLKHLGMFLDGVEDTSSDEVKKWAPSFENYTLERIGPDKTRFKLSMDTPEEWEEMMMDMWPKAFKKLKEVCETSGESA